MGNVNCIPSRRGMSDWIRSKVKHRKKITDVSESGANAAFDNNSIENFDGDVDANFAKETVKRPEDRLTEPYSESSKSVSDRQEYDIERAEKYDLVDAIGHIQLLGSGDVGRPASRPHNYRYVIEDKNLDENKNESVAPNLERPYDEDEEISSDDNTSGDFKDTHDLEDNLVDTDRSLRSYGLCMFGDEISEDPVEASLLASGLQDVKPGTRDAIDDMLMFRTFPMVKAIERINADECGFLRRTDPIPEGERSGSIRDLGWSRHMKNPEKEEADRWARRIRGPHEYSSQQTTYVSQGNRRFSKCTDHMNDHIDEEEDALDQYLSKRRNRRPHDMISKQSGPGEGSGLIQRQTSHWKLPPVD